MNTVPRAPENEFGSHSCLASPSPTATRPQNSTLQLTLQQPELPGASPSVWAPEPPRDGSLGSADGPVSASPPDRAATVTAAVPQGQALLPPAGLPRPPTRPRSGAPLLRRSWLPPGRPLGARVPKATIGCRPPEFIPWVWAFWVTPEPQLPVSVPWLPRPQSPPGMEGSRSQGSVAALRTRASLCNSPFTSRKWPVGSWGCG